MEQLPFVGMYIHYFEYLAKMHPSLRHRTEIGGKTFDVVLQRDIKELTMARIDINSAADFIMVLVIPTTETEPSEDANTNRHLTCGFFILKKYAARVDVKNGWWVAMNDCEILAYQILQRMVADSNAKYPLFHRQADRLENLNPRFTERVVEEKWCGYLVTFTIKNLLPSCPTLPCAWLDAGTTPLIL